MSLEDELHHLRDAQEPEREVSLGTATILGIFFLLALLCAGFFGFGYSLGRRSVKATLIPAAPAPEGKQDSPFSDFKTAPAPAPKQDDASDAVQQPSAAPPKAPGPSAREPQTANTTEEASSIPPGQFVVQVSAPTFQKDAEHLVSVLKQQGYVAFIRRQPGDQFFHVQIGPYASKADAEIIRKKLESDGYKLPFIPAAK